MTAVWLLLSLPARWPSGWSGLWLPRWQLIQGCQQRWRCCVSCYEGSCSICKGSRCRLLLAELQVWSWLRLLCSQRCGNPQQACVVRQPLLLG
jgi:hypothetical protein